MAFMSSSNDKDPLHFNYGRFPVVIYNAKEMAIIKGKNVTVYYLP